ncbi:hypothetical protein FANTH_4974 [Fusarium anthophilum]|uniref:Uncharacterized protein n=1 Tax=Fusarium anthophilum TaxID=48485 RepID=A0A8H5E7M9_9HYPO|nr:hypothetical protein FANTH_4974 [Fusarium anthophilum]
MRKRLQLYDRQAVIPDLTGSGLPKLDKTTREPQRFMAIITAPYLFDSGRQADWGRFCLGRKDETEEKTKHLRIKYTREEVSEHIARLRQVLLYHRSTFNGCVQTRRTILELLRLLALASILTVEGTRAAGPADIDGCKKALGRLHKLGIKLSDINKHNFLVQDGYEVLVDFKKVKRDCLPLELEDEISTLKSSPKATSFRVVAEPAYE